MSDTPNDELRLRENNTSQTQAIPPPATPTATSSHLQRRRFVRDGEVPVTVIHRDQSDASGSNALEATRQALREQVATREHAEHLLQEAQATIHDLQTKLAHERLARDEAIQHVGSEKQVLERALQRAQEELAAERDSRRSAEQERDDGIAAHQEAEERLREVLASKDTRTLSPASSKPTNNPAGGSDKPMLVRRRERPAKSHQSEPEFVEWWKPGWRDRLR